MQVKDGKALEGPSTGSGHASNLDESMFEQGQNLTHGAFDAGPSPVSTADSISISEKPGENSARPKRVVRVGDNQHAHLACGRKNCGGILSILKCRLRVFLKCDCRMGQAEFSGESSRSFRFSRWKITRAPCKYDAR